MKRLIISAFVLCSINALANESTCISKNGTVNVDASLVAKTEMLHTVKHHWKFDFWRGAVCWGRPDDQHQDNESNSQSSKLCTGALVYTTNKPGYHNYTPVKLSWGANLTENDVFKVSFTEQTVAASYSNAGSSRCHTHRYGTKLDAYTGKFAANTQIEIPPDVWILSVRTVKNKEHKTDMDTFIGRASTDKKVVDQVILKETWKYLYVQPGEKIDLLVQHQSNDLNSDKKFDVDFEFRFVGHNRCEEVLGAYEKFNYSANVVDNLILQNPQTEDERNFYAIRLGCLRNKAYLQAGMANSRPGYLLPVMERISERTQLLMKELSTKYKEESKAGTSIHAKEIVNLEFMNDILNMTLLDMGRFALSDLSAYCKTYRVFTREGAGMGNVGSLQGIEYSTNILSRIRSVLAQFPQESFKSFADMLKASEAEGVTYQSKMRDTKDVDLALRVLGASLIKRGYNGFSVISKLVESLPVTVINSTERNEILTRLKKANEQAAMLDIQVSRILGRFSEHNPKIIESGHVFKYAEILSQNIQDISSLIEAHMAWYVASNGESKFVEDVSTISREYVARIAEALSYESPRRNLTNFVKKDEINTLVNQIDQCIRNPEGDL